ncbi:mitochondrial fission ELM1 family protein [Marinobacteraceae bacterium S3BR75-40.1]
MTGPQERNGPVVWLLADHKPGHKNQLRGLAERLENLAGARLIWIDVTQYPVPLFKTLLGIPPRIEAPWPNIIVAAGSDSHRLMAACRKRFGALMVMIMRPSFPFRWIDLAIIPAHDNPPSRPDVLETRGVMNAVRPQSKPVTKHRGLILIGGTSRHYVWDNDAIFRQALTLAEEYPDWAWSVTSSRRTPSELVQRLQDLAMDNVVYHHHDQTPPAWLPTTLSESRVAWVSPDSVSMVYEALTAGLPTGLFELQAHTGSRVVKGLQSLAEEGLTISWSNRKALMRADNSHRPHLWEADRAARWILEHYKERFE